MQHFALVVTLVATAASGTASLDAWRYEPLRDDSRASELLKRRVVSPTGQPMGEVRNVLLDRRGNFEALSVAFDHPDADAVAQALFEWSDVAIGESDVTASLGSGASAAGTPIAGQGMSLRKLIGLPVRLDGERFGTVEDVLFEADGDRASALLIAAGDTTYALPLTAIPAGAESIDLPYQVREVRELGEFKTGDTPSSAVRPDKRR